MNVYKQVGVLSKLDKIIDLFRAEVKNMVLLIGILKISTTLLGRKGRRLNTHKFGTKAL